MTSTRCSSFVHLLVWRLALNPPLQQESSLEAVKKWAIFAREHEPAVCLLVGNELAAANTGPGCADAAQSWALDNNFEYIEVPCFSSWSDDASNSGKAAFTMYVCCMLTQSGAQHLPRKHKPATKHSALGVLMKRFNATSGSTGR